MNIKQYKPILLTSIISIIALLIHKTIFLLFAPNHVESEFIYSLPELYGLFFLLSALILFILIKISQISMTNVGFIFLFLTTFKMGVAYIFLKPILKTHLANPSIEKINSRSVIWSRRFSRFKFFTSLYSEGVKPNVALDI